MIDRNALVGYTGFVGSTLRRQRRFDAEYNSKNIAAIAGQGFDRIVCAAAPATMWAANQDPAADKANLDALAAFVEQAVASEIVLISTIAVLDDASAGYREDNARFEMVNAYGRNRRALEERLAAAFPRCHVLRLPALFGVGLRKNFVFDLLNPVPSFLRPEKFAEVRGASAVDPALLDGFYSFDEVLGMWSLDRAALDTSAERGRLTGMIEEAGFAARNFTNSASRFQYYDMSRLAEDIDRVVAACVPEIHMAVEPLCGSEIALAVTGQPFENAAPPIVSEDMRSCFATLFGGAGDYLIDARTALAGIEAFSWGAYGE